MRIPYSILNKAEELVGVQKYSDDDFNKLMENNFPNISKIQKTRILEAAAIAFYHKELEYPIVKILMADDAPQFKLLTNELALCWVHDGRHYKKLRPVVPDNVKILKIFQKKYWKYYKELLKFRKKPTKEKADRLTIKFDKLFSTETGYADLDKRIGKSKQKKNELLLVLKHPNLPLHNNAAELAARAQVRLRDVSLHTKTEEGTKAKDTFLSIFQTAKKLGINSYQYILDRINGKYILPSLADAINRKCKKDNYEFCDSG